MSQKKRPGRHLKHWIKAEPLCALYIKLNEALFDSVLPDIPCYINPRLSRCLGRCLYYRDGDISVPYAIDFSRCRSSMISLTPSFTKWFMSGKGRWGVSPITIESFIFVFTRKKKYSRPSATADGYASLPEMITNMYPAPPNRSPPPPASKKAFPWTGWSVNPKYNTAFDEVQ